MSKGIHMSTKCEMLEFDRYDEKDGSLVCLETGKTIPFEVKRIFYIFDSPMNTIRADHANKNTDFIIINLRGNTSIEIEDKFGLQTFVLKDPSKAVFVPKMKWIRIHCEKESLLLVLANTRFEKSHYIEDYNVFKNLLLK